MPGITWRDRKIAPWITEQTKAEDVFSTTKKKKLNISRTCHTPKR